MYFFTSTCLLSVHSEVSLEQSRGHAAKRVSGHLSSCHSSARHPGDNKHQQWCKSIYVSPNDRLEHWGGSNHDTHLFTEHNWIKGNQGRCCCYSVLTYSEKLTYFGKILLSCLQGEMWQACSVVTGIRLVGVLMCAGWCHASRRRCFLSDETAGQQTWGDVMISESLRTCVEVVLS